MASTGSSWGSGRPRGPMPARQRNLVIIVVAAAIIALELGRHKITRFEVIYFLVLVPSIILHEISHGVVALAFGDDTAKRAGRLTLNPVRHVDPVGTLLVPAILSLSGLGAYGWAKPVPVSPNRLRHPRNETVLVSLVGPLTNFALAAVLAVVLVLVTPSAVRAQLAQYGVIALFVPQAQPEGWSLLSQVLYIAGFANIVLGLFNCLPCPPLDGAAILERLIPARHLGDYYRLQPALMFLPFLLILLFHNQWASLIDHAFNWWAGRLG
ncbi:MAG: site-2 protease family protein [Acidimicrobiales bacterium]|nr:site-2 protease family protein [Acidimicrobiales bacterium]